jgi:hypothetical protein
MLKKAKAYARIWYGVSPTHPPNWRQASYHPHRYLIDSDFAYSALTDLRSYEEWIYAVRDEPEVWQKERNILFKEIRDSGLYKYYRNARRPRKTKKHPEGRRLYDVAQFGLSYFKIEQKDLPEGVAWQSLTDEELYEILQERHYWAPQGVPSRFWHQAFSTFIKTGLDNAIGEIFNRVSGSHNNNPSPMVALALGVPVVRAYYMPRG